MTTRLLVISDLHCGHDVGLTHPDFDVGSARGEHYYEIRRASWDWYKKVVHSLRPDILIVNGDAVDGQGPRSGGIELIQPDVNRQIKMAVAAIDTVWGNPEIYMAYGTPYHTGQNVDWEDQIADKVNALKIGGEDTINIDGTMVNYRHKVGRSDIPHGRHTAVAKERLWNLLWAERGEYPKADIILRSHVHYHAGAFGPGWVAMTTPCLQGYGGRYGTREMSGIVDFGVTSFDFQGGTFGWEVHLRRFPAADIPLAGTN